MRQNAPRRFSLAGPHRPPAPLPHRGKNSRHEHTHPAPPVATNPETITQEPPGHRRCCFTKAERGMNHREHGGAQRLRRCANGNGPALRATLGCRPQVVVAEGAMADFQPAALESTDQPRGGKEGEQQCDRPGWKIIVGASPPQTSKWTIVTVHMLRPESKPSSNVMIRRGKENIAERSKTIHAVIMLNVQFRTCNHPCSVLVVSDVFEGTANASTIR